MPGGTLRQRCELMPPTCVGGPRSAGICAPSVGTCSGASIDAQMSVSLNVQAVCDGSNSAHWSPMVH
eukprot:355214-Chlamydomonas_euryale.AAC.4